jgi:GT2 family glycosyltransferase
LPGGQGVRIVLADGNIGFADGVNRCLAETPDADAWWVLNPDTQPEPGALADCVRRLEVGDCDAVGCTLFEPDGEVSAYGGLWRPLLARAVSLGHGRSLSDPVDAAAVERSQNYLVGAAMLVSRRWVETVGQLRGEYFIYCEEVEWCIRGMFRGMRLGFSPTALVKHAQGSTTGSNASMKNRPRLPIYLNERNRILLTRDLYPQYLPVAAVTSLALIVLKYGRRYAWKQLGYGLSGWWAGMRDRRGRPDWIPA